MLKAIDRYNEQQHDLLNKSNFGIKFFFQKNVL